VPEWWVMSSTTGLLVRKLRTFASMPPALHVHSLGIAAHSARVIKAVSGRSPSIDADVLELIEILY